MNHQETTDILIHFSPFSIHRRIKRKQWNELKIDWYDFLVDCEKKYQKTKCIFKKHIRKKLTLNK